jgi:hypothetical protein
LERWKRRDAYCRAVLDYPTRIALDGSQTGETVDDFARAAACEDIARCDRGFRAGEPRCRA